LRSEGASGRVTAASFFDLDFFKADSRLCSAI